MSSFGYALPILLMVMRSMWANMTSRENTNGTQELRISNLSHQYIMHDCSLQRMYVVEVVVAAVPVGVAVVVVVLVVYTAYPGRKSGAANHHDAKKRRPMEPCGCRQKQSCKMVLKQLSKPSRTSD